MARLDHISVSVADLDLALAQYDPVMTALGGERDDGDGSAAWAFPDDTEFIVMQAREPDSGPHVHGRVGWQHLAFAVDSRAEVDRLHDVALAAGWSAVRDPKLYPRFNERYYAAFVECADGIRLEFMHSPGASA